MGDTECLRTHSNVSGERRHTRYAVSLLNVIRHLASDESSTLLTTAESSVGLQRGQEHCHVNCIGQVMAVIPPLVDNNNRRN